jgi:proteasome lid subunit RPN8/RPN11
MNFTTKGNKHVAVHIPESALASFKRRAMRSEDEIFACMVGKVFRENARIVRIDVENFYYPSVDSGEDWVRVPVEELIDVQKVVESTGATLVGTIHSHPACEPGLSPEDIHSAARMEEAVFGVFSWWRPEDSVRRRTQFDFYLGAPGLAKVKAV